MISFSILLVDFLFHFFSVIDLILAKFGDIICGIIQAFMVSRLFIFKLVVFFALSVEVIQRSINISSLDIGCFYPVSFLQFSAITIFVLRVRFCQSTRFFTILESINILLGVLFVFIAEGGLYRLGDAYDGIIFVHYRSRCWLCCCNLSSGNKWLGVHSIHFLIVFFSFLSCFLSRLWLSIIQASPCSLRINLI